MIELNIGLDGVPNSKRLQIGNKYENNDEVIKFILPIEFENYKKYVITVIKKNNEKVTKVFPITDNQFFVSTDITYISGNWSMYLMCRENEIDLEAEEIDISANNGEHVFISDGFIGVVSDSDIDKELVDNIPMDTNLHIVYEDLLKLKQELIDKINTPTSYNDLVDVPTKVSQFENDKKYQTEEEVTALELKITEEINTRESAITELKGDLAELNTIRKKIKSIDGYIGVDGIIKQSTISKVYYFECEQNTLYYFNANKITKLPDNENFVIGELSNDIFIGANVGRIHSSTDLVKTYASSGNAKYICFCIPRISENVFFVEELYKMRQNQSDNNEINIIDNMRVSFSDINNDGHFKEIFTRDDDFIITDYIEITNDTLLFEYGYNYNKLLAVACFDSNKKLLYGYLISNDRKISFKSEVKYIIATVPKIKGANISKNDGSIVFIYNDFNLNYLKLKEKMDYIQNGSDYLHYIFAFCSPTDETNEYIVIRNDRISTLDYIKTNGNSFKFVIPKGLKMYLWQYRDDFSYIQSGYGHDGIVTIKPIGEYIKCSFKTLDGSDISMDMLNDFSLRKIDESIIEEIPSTYPEEVGYRKAEQWVNLKWTPKNKVPKQGGASYFPANTERIGMLYAEGAYQDKRVGADVSLRTFMTAINNPYSLMYTENTNENHSQSAYGVTYYGDYNSGAYMGMSCNIFVYNVLGSPITWSSFETDGGSAIDENIVEKVYDQSSHGLRLMDILATQGHVRIVSRLWRNKRNVVKKIQVSEIVGSGAINVLYSDTEFDSFLKNNNYRIYRFKELYKNIDYEQSPFVTLDDEDVLSYTYNNDICTFAGDYASFAEGDLIHINYEKGIYTSMQIYKDDNLIDTISIGEGHDVDLTNKNYSYGKYKARLTDGTNHSDFTYWEILNLEISLNGEELTYSSENGRPVFWSWCEYRGWHKHKHSLVGEDSHKTINVGNRPDSTYKYIKVYVDGEYGRIARRLVVE